jgi:hypothetical protein
MDRRLAEGLAWYGAVAILTAYFLVSFKVVPPDSALYQVLNLTGAIGLLVISLIKRVFQTVAVNAFWAAIALIALVAVFLRY